MKREDIELLISPKTHTETQIINDSEFITGVLWGKPRPGHPEGEVLLHVKEVLDNVDKYFKEDRDWVSLRLISIIHDSFKYKVDRDKHKSGENHHAMIARRFAEKYIENTSLLDIIELHDEIYNSFMMIERKNNVRGAEKRIDTLIERLGDNFDLFVKFTKCDSETGDKELSCNIWFKNLMQEKHNKQINL